MQQYRRIIAAGAILTTALAQSSENATTVTTVISFAGDIGVVEGGFYASLVDENDDVATLALDCGPETATADVDFPDCIIYRGLTLTAGASTFHMETGCEPSATICLTIDCTAPTSAAATCIGTTTAPALFLFSDDELSSMSFDPWTLSGTAADPYTSIASTTVTTEIPTESLASMVITITAGAPAQQTTGGSSGGDDDSSSTGTEAQGDSSSATGESAVASPTDGSSGAGRLSLSVSGGVAGVFAVVLAAL